MTDDDKVKAVIATLEGSFYVGQRVKHYINGNVDGTVTRLSTRNARPVVAVRWDGDQTENWFVPAFLRPL